MAAERSIEESPDTASFRAWLAEHHATSPGIWLRIGKKNSGLVATTHDEALEAALAYGWIDGQTRPGDAKRPETRASRIAKFVDMLARGEKIYG